MLAEALPLVLVVELGVVGQSEVDGAAEDGVDVDVAIGLGNNLAVERAGRLAGGGPVVLDSLTHNLNLFSREPALQSGVGRQNLAARDVVDGTGTGHAEVVVGGNAIDHVDVGTGDAHQVEGIADDTRDVLQVVGTVKLGVLGQYLGLNEFDEVEAGSGHGK